MSRCVLIILSCCWGALWGQNETPTPWYVEALNLPASGLSMSDDSEPVIIAVVDDGFRLTHAVIAPFLYRSAGEIPDNQQDDDGNGWVDDVSGWDVADADADVLPPPERMATYYHGTFVAGAIADLLTRTYGTDASRFFKILPVKAVSDFASRPYVRYGYEGVRYAINQGADLIVCAWNGGTEDQERRALFQEARRKGIAVIASAGNSYTEKALPPASFPEVIAVAAVDHAFRRLSSSSYGMFVDLAGPGRQVVGADVRQDEGLRTEDATSAAVSAAAACMAILRHAAPRQSAEEHLGALKNAARPLDAVNPSFAGKLGSGFPDVEKALAHLKALDNCCVSHNPRLPEGRLHHGFIPDHAGSFEWRLSPDGAFKGIRLEMQQPSRLKTPAVLRVLTPDGEPAGEMPLNDPSAKLFVPGNAARVQYLPNGSGPPPSFAVDYYVETIDSSTLYCSGKRFHELDEGRITDGSASRPYANNCDCKWQIRVGEGQRIRLRFSDFDTEPSVDHVYLFDGESTRPDRIIARFSGPDLPPVVTSRTNQVLLWFVTDAQHTAQGWTLEYEAVDGN